MRALCLAAAFAICAAPAFANARLSVLLDVLRMSEAIEIMRDEGLDYAEALNRDMLAGEGGPLWQAQVNQIYDRNLISEQVRAALANGLSSEHIEATIAFFNTPTGDRIVKLENAARRAMSDPALEETAREIFATRTAEDDPMVDLVTRYIDVNDLLERNVSGLMSSNYQFFKALNDGRLTDESEAEILAEVWSQEEDIRRDTESWLGAFLLMAYQPLTVETLRDYVAFSETDAGQALNAALFDGFNAVYSDISYALGRAVALNATTDQI